MIFLEFSRIIKFSGQSFLRNIWLSIVTITIITLTLLSISFLLIFNLTTKHILSAVESKTAIYVDLTNQATAEQAGILTDELKKLPTIDQAEFITPELTLNNFKERHKDDPVILDSLNSLENNPFRGSIRLTVKSINDFPVILAELSKKEYVSYLEVEDKEFKDAQILISGISDVSQKIQKGGMIISLAFILIAIMVVFNTIQVGIYTHREEIGIMRLVGASNSFIRSPFLLEGVIYSLAALIIMVGLIYPLMMFLQPYVNNFLKDYTLNLVQTVNTNWLLVFGTPFIAACVINVASSFLAVRRYIKV